MDRDTELIIQENINRFFPGMTKIIITHRPFMIDKASKVLMLDKNGNHQETSKENDLLKKIL